MKTAMVIVVYNKWCGDSCTCRFLTTTPFPPDVVLVMDNSTKPMENESFCKQNGWLYHSMGGNAGLSKAYNAALEQIWDQADIIVWADDDTVWPADYFRSLHAHMESNDASVYLPIVKSDGVILSPCIFSTGEMGIAHSEEELKHCEISAINSGMAVKTQLYAHYRYDEKYFLDYIDHDFMRWCRQNAKAISIVDGITLHQNFFAKSGASKKSKRVRFRIYRKDYARFQRKCGVSYFKICDHLFRKFVYEQFLSK